MSEPVFYTRRLHAGSDSNKSFWMNSVFSDAEEAVRQHLPQGRRKQLALTHLEIASMFAHKAALEKDEADEWEDEADEWELEHFAQVTV